VGKHPIFRDEGERKIVPITIETDELTPLRTVMRDLQLSVSRYYVGAASGEDLGALVREFITHTQTLNDWLSNAIGDAVSYKLHFGAPRHPRSDYIDAVKYVRNVSQHVMHVVAPDDEVRLVGGSLGMRFYARWDEVPVAVDAKLRPGTQRLKPTYDAMLFRKDVMGTMMEVLRFYADVVPSIVHRDSHGEWTGFPLMNQPGMSHALHPEEPSDWAEALEWMDSRRPGGSSRVICGQVTVEGSPYVVGFTFDGRHSFAAFSETIEQINFDISLGFPYFSGDLLTNVVVANEQFPDALQGVVLSSREAIETWGTAESGVEVRDDWMAFEDDSWGKFVGLENKLIVPESMRYEVRRARRLNALKPPSAVRRR
tara:strand:- start:2616 stop:3725 length:1110 start_codon:yes stop_codon:yes gene_type:complete